MLEKIENVLKDFKGDDSIAITETTTFEELGVDSLDTVELVMKIEDEFGITIEMNEPVKDIGGLLKIINAQQEG